VNDEEEKNWENIRDMIEELFKSLRFTTSEAIWLSTRINQLILYSYLGRMAENRVARKIFRLSGTRLQVDEGDS
jgi:hypothetical protein